MKRIVIVVSSPYTVSAFLLNHIIALCDRYEVWVVANVSSATSMAFLPSAAREFPVRIERQIAPIHDLRALWRLFRFFRRHRFDLVHSVTPKAGLLAMAAGSFAGIPTRIHTFTGQVWATRKGLTRLGLKSIDRLTATMATDVFADSRSQREFLVEERVVSAARLRVVAAGSIAGVDTGRFRPDLAARDEIRRQLGIGADDFVFLFVGRLKRDKGILQLAEAFRQVSNSREGCWLVCVGVDEEGLSTLPALVDNPRIQLMGSSSEPEKYMAAADVLCLPSRREGFGVVAIEAAAVGVPAVASRIYGVVDAVEDGITGLLHRPDDVDDLGRCMTRMASDPTLRARLGASGRRRAIAEFDARIVTQALLDAYKQLIGEGGEVT